MEVGGCASWDCGATVTRYAVRTTWRRLGRRQAGGQRMHVRRDRVGEDLEAVDEPRPRAAEVGVAVRHVDAAGADRRQRVEAGLPRQDRQIAARPRHVEAAAGDQQDVGIGGADVVPGDRARPRAGDAEQRPAAGERDQLGRPVAGAERRIDPFEHGDGGGRLHAARHAPPPRRRGPAARRPPRVRAPRRRPRPRRGRGRRRHPRGTSARGSRRAAARAARTRLRAPRRRRPRRRRTAPA